MEWGEGVGGGCLNDGIFKRKFSKPFPFFPFLVRCDTSEEVLEKQPEGGLCSDGEGRRIGL